MSATPEAPWVIHLTNGGRRLAKEAHLEVEGVHYEPLFLGPRDSKVIVPDSIFIPWHMVFEVKRFCDYDVQEALEKADIEAHDGHPFEYQPSVGVPR